MSIYKLHLSFGKKEISRVLNLGFISIFFLSSFSVFAPQNFQYVFGFSVFIKNESDFQVIEVFLFSNVGPKVQCTLPPCTYPRFP